MLFSILAGATCVAEEVVERQLHPKLKPKVVFPVDGIPYAKGDDFRAGIGVDGSYYIPEHVPDILQPMGVRPRGLLMRQIKTIPRDPVKDRSVEQSKDLQGAVSAETSASTVQNEKAVIAPKKEEEAKALEEITVAPFVDWLKNDASAVEKAVKANKNYEKTPDIKPTYDKANRVFFEMRFPYSGVTSSGQKSDSSAVIYTTPRKNEK